VSRLLIPVYLTAIIKLKKVKVRFTLPYLYPKAQRGSSGIALLLP
jgi:hypothetical protein